MSVNAIEELKSTISDGIRYGFGVHQCTSEGITHVNLDSMFKKEGSPCLIPQGSTETRVSE